LNQAKEKNQMSRHDCSSTLRLQHNWPFTRFLRQVNHSGQQTMKTHLKTMTLLLAMAMATAPAAASATAVFKWIDADGVTHFGDRQPTGIQAEQISVRSGPSSFVNNNSSARQRVNELEQQQTAREASRAVDATATRQAQRKTRCDTAQQNLGIISNNARIRITEDGEQRFLTPNEVSQQKQAYEDIAGQNCGAEKAL
jgi:hypothetical protein